MEKMVRYPMGLFTRSVYFRKLLALIVLVGIIPVGLLGIYSYIISTNIAEKKVVEGNGQILLQSKQKIEQLLQTVDYLATQFITARSTLQAVGQYNLLQEHDEVTREFYQSLTRLQMIGTGIRDVALVSLNQGWVIDNVGLSSLADESNRELIALADTAMPAYWIGDETSKSILFVKKIPVYAVNPTGLIVFRIPSFELVQLLAQSPLTGVTSILNADLQVLASSDHSSFMQPMPESEHLKRSIQADSLLGNMTVQLDGKDHLLTYEKSPYSQWIYLSNIDRGQISKDSRQIGWTTLYISLALFALTFILTLTGSRFVYEPVGKLYEYVARFGGKTELSSGTDELQRIRLVFESLLDKQNKLDKELFGHTSQLDELFTMKLLLGKVRAGDIWDSLQHFGHATEWQERYVVVIQIDSWEDTLYDERDRNLLMFAINNIVEELIPKETRIKPVYMDMHQVTLVGNTDPGSGDFNAYIDSVYDKIQTSIKNVLKIKVSIGISRPFFDWFYAPKAYEEGTEALKYRIILDEESIVRIEDVRPDRHKTYEYPDNLESELISVIKTGNLLMAEKHLVLFTQEVVRQKLDHKEYQMMLLRLLIRLLQVNDSIKEPISPTGAVYTEFLNLRTVNEMEEWLKVSLIEPLIQFVKQASDEQHRTISRQVMDLVGAMYDKPLTLEACAAQLNYNSSYISKVFRKETGIKFIDYLQTHRMNVAKQWLVETDMKISQIAERLQYNNAQNFIRYFRRTEGMTPGQYREQNQ